MKLTFNQKRFLAILLMACALLSNLNSQYQWNLLGAYDEIVNYILLLGVFAFFIVHGPAFMDEMREYRATKDRAERISELDRTLQMNRLERLSLVATLLLPFAIGPMKSILQSGRAETSEWVIAAILSLLVGVVYKPIARFRKSHLGERPEDS